MALLQRPFVPENCEQAFGMHKRFWREVEAFLFGGFLGEVRGAFPEKKAPSLILSECFEESDLANGLHRGQRVG